MLGLSKTERNKQKDFAVIGLGRFGRSVVRTLSERGYNVLGLDKDPQKVQYVSEYCTQAVVVDSTNEDSLKALEIGR